MSSTEPPIVEAPPPGAPEGLGRFEFLVSAVAGRSLQVVPLEAAEESYCDGTTIFVPVGPDGEPDVAALIAHASMVGAGTLEPAVLRQVSQRKDVLRRYLSLEGRRATAALRDVAPPVPELDGIEARSASASESLQLAKAPGPIQEPLACFGTLKTRAVRRAEREKSASRVAASEQALELDEPPDDEIADDEEEVNEESKILKLLSSPLSSPLSMLKSLLRSTGMGGDDGGGDSGGELRMGRAPGGVANGRHPVLALVPTGLEPVEAPDGTGTTYPEFDVHHDRYRPQWVTVRDVDPVIGRSWSGPPCPPDLVRRLANLGLGLQRERRQSQGDDLDLDALVDLRVEVVAGTEPDEAIYIENQRQRRSLSVLVLLDVSGSSNEGSAGAEPVHARQSKCAAMLTEALHDLGDRVGLYAFRSLGRSAVHVLRVKSFDDALDSRAYGRLASIEPSSYTRLGGAIRHATRILETQSGTEQRLLVVLSDGVPYDYGYQDAYAEGDARRALWEARRAGVGCLCLTLGSHTAPAALGRVFGTAAYASATDFDELTPRLELLFVRALDLAERNRRLARRVGPSPHLQENR